MFENSIIAGIIIILCSIVFYREFIRIQPHKFEPNESSSIKNKYFVFFEFTLVLRILRAISELPFSEDSFSVMANLIDLVLFAVLLYMLLNHKKGAFMLSYVVISLLTWSMTLTASLNDEESIFLYLFIYIGVWLVPNYLYFIKRRNMFEELDKTNEINKQELEKINQFYESKYSSSNQTFDNSNKIL